MLPAKLFRILIIAFFFFIFSDRSPKALRTLTLNEVLTVQKLLYSLPVMLGVVMSNGDEPHSEDSRLIVLEHDVVSESDDATVPRGCVYLHQSDASVSLVHQDAMLMSKDNKVL